MESQMPMSDGSRSINRTLTLAIAFLLGFLNFVRFEFVGSIAVNEILLLATAVLSLPRLFRTAQLPRFRSVLILGTCYAGSLIFSDIYRDTPSSDYLRGWARLSFTLLALLASTAVFLKDSRALLAFLIGWLAAPLGSLVLYGVQTDLYKFYLALPVSGGAFLLVGYARKNWRGFTNLLPLLTGGLAFSENARSFAGLTILAHALYLFKTRRPNPWQKHAPAWVRNVRLAFTGLGVVVVCAGIIKFYVIAAPRGMLGAEARAKYEMQMKSELGQKYSLLAGRTEILFSWPKIMASPLIGYGSWARDVDYVRERAAELDMPLGQIPIESREDGLIPTHSHIFSGWVEAGLLGAVFWCVVFWRTVNLLIRDDLSFYLGSLTPIFIFLLVIFCWDLILSPYGGERRFWNGFILAWIAWTELRIRATGRNTPRSIPAAIASDPQCNPG